MNPVSWHPFTGQLKVPILWLWACFFRSDEFVNRRSHPGYLQTKGFSPVCVLNNKVEGLVEVRSESRCQWPLPTKLKSRANYFSKSYIVPHSTSNQLLKWRWAIKNVYQALVPWINSNIVALLYRGIIKTKPLGLFYSISGTSNLHKKAWKFHDEIPDGQTWRVFAYFRLEQIVFGNLLLYKQMVFLQYELGSDSQVCTEHQSLSYILDILSNCNYLLIQSH